MVSTTTDRSGIAPEEGIKAPCVAAAAVNITLSGLQTIDTVVTAENDRVFLPLQTDTAENGIYYASTGTWTRAPDFNDNSDLISGMLVNVSGGTVAGKGGWQIIYSGSLSLGTTNLTCEHVWSGSQIGDMLKADNLSGMGNTATSRANIAAAGETAENHFTKTQSWSKGADVASATALTVGTDGNYFDVTGTTAITSITTVGIGTAIKLHFDGILTLTHHATDLILLGGANITTAAGDEAEFIEYATGDWRCIAYSREDGTPLVDGIAAASQAEQEATTAIDVMTTPGRQQYHPSASKLWCAVGRSAGTPSLSSPSYNIASVTDDGAGQTIVTIMQDFSTAVYAPHVASRSTAPRMTVVHSLAVGSFKVKTYDSGGSADDTTDFTCDGFGDQT